MHIKVFKRKRRSECFFHDLFHIELPRSFHHQEDYTPSVDSAMESWDSSNTDHRLSDNSEITKEILINDHQDASVLHLPRSK
jgi:hypothetical protein